MPLAAHFKLSTEQNPTSENGKVGMKNVPCSSSIGSLMCAMIYIKLDIA